MLRKLLCFESKGCSWVDSVSRPWLE